MGQNVFMSSKQALFSSNTDCDDGRCKGSENNNENLNEWRRHVKLTGMSELLDSTVSVAPSELLLVHIDESSMVL